MYFFYDLHVHHENHKLESMIHIHTYNLFRLYASNWTEWLWMAWNETLQLSIKLEGIRRKLKALRDKSLAQGLTRNKLHLGVPCIQLRHKNPRCFNLIEAMQVIHMSNMLHRGNLQSRKSMARIRLHYREESLWKDIESSICSI